MEVDQNLRVRGGVRATARRARTGGRSPSVAWCMVWWWSGPRKMGSFLARFYIQFGSFICRLPPLCCKLGRCLVSYGRVNPFIVVILKRFCNCVCCLLIVGKLTGPNVLFFEGLVKRFYVSVLFRCVLPDKLVLSDSQRFYGSSKVVACILVALSVLNRSILQFGFSAATASVIDLIATCLVASGSNAYPTHTRVWQSITLKQQHQPSAPHQTYVMSVSHSWFGASGLKSLRFVWIMSFLVFWGSI